MLVAGFKHRWAVLALLVIIVGSLATVQLPGGMSSSLERDALVFVGLLVLLAEPQLGYALGSFSAPSADPGADEF
ncbi:MAG: hypothetical protein ACE5FP_03120, partial [Gemmatimonadota bacterium]